jgi:hypothetical protein
MPRVAITAELLVCIRELKKVGLTNYAIAQLLHIDDHTIARNLRGERKTLVPASPEAVVKELRRVAAQIEQTNVLPNQP